jgi:GntR family transcriptional regulator, rspAB operon transcriptional repressor
MPAAYAFPPAKQTSASFAERAYLVIRDRILKGEFPLGSALSRRKLAAELHMSLVPVAEALQRLENDELVESRPRIGTRVCLPAAQKIRERYEVREALESQSARLFAQRASGADRRELLEKAEQMDALFNRCFAGGDNDREFLFAVHRFHTQFHLRIAECTGCQALCKAIERNNVLTFNWLYDVAARRPPLPPRFHRDLMDSINSGDPETADRAMRQHVRHGLENVVRVVGQAGGLPKS